MKLAINVWCGLINLCCFAILITVITPHGSIKMVDNYKGSWTPLWAVKANVTQYFRLKVLHHAVLKYLIMRFLIGEYQASQ